jgi:enoyl-CoA hydratase/carnithine racemase
MSYRTIITEQVNRVAIITLNRPQVLNALSLELVREVDEALVHFEQDDGVGAIIITGSGERAFSAGADIHENRELSYKQHEESQDLRAVYTWHLANCIKPVIGAINGLCYGGATVMATAMDFLIGCDQTSFRFLAVNYGRMNATWSLPGIVGCPIAKELLFSGRAVLAEEAFRIGLLNHLVRSDQVLEKAVDVAASIAKNRIHSVANIKKILLEHSGLSLEEQFWNEVKARKGRFKEVPVEEGFKDFLTRKGRKPRNL